MWALNSWWETWFEHCVSKLVSSGIQISFELINNDRCCGVIQLKFRKCILNKPSLWVVVVPERELNFKDWWFLSRSDFNNVDILLVSAIRQIFKHLVSVLERSVLLELIWFSANPNEKFVISVKNIYIFGKKVLLSESRDLLHVSVTRRIWDLEKSWFKTVGYGHLFLNFAIIALSFDRYPEISVFCSFQ